LWIVDELEIVKLDVFCPLDELGTANVDVGSRLDELDTLNADVFSWLKELNTLGVDVFWRFKEFFTTDVDFCSPSVVWCFVDLSLYLEVIISGYAYIHGLQAIYKFFLM